MGVDCKIIYLPLGCLQGEVVTRCGPLREPCSIAQYQNFQVYSPVPHTGEFVCKTEGRTPTFISHNLLIKLF